MINVTATNSSVLTADFFGMLATRVLEEWATSPELDAFLVHCGGRWISLTWGDHDVHIANLAGVHRAVTLGIDVLCN